MPGVQNPHWVPCSWRRASWRPVSSPPRSVTPSMVVTREPAADAVRIRQLLTDRPSSRTTQVPHWPVSQPTLVPVSPRPSRSRSTSSSFGSAENCSGLPFTFSEISMPAPALP